MIPDPWFIDGNDIKILRDLYKRQREIAQDPVMQERRQLWTRHAALDSTRPMILAETGGVLDELIPLSTLRCQADWARQMERGLRELIFRYEHVRDDFVILPWIQYGWVVTVGDFGVQTELVRGDNEGKLGSYHWDPPIKDLDKDFDKLHFRELSVDREQTAAWATFLETYFGDIMPVRLRANYWWTTGLTWTAINLIGLEPSMMAMYDNPAGLHRLMAFLSDECLHFLEWFEREGLLTLNNENDYVGSGSQGWTMELGINSGKGTAKSVDQPVRLRDLWGLSESQETVGVSPKMFEEFIFPYQLPVISRFGLSYYGCCEPIHNRWRVIKRIPNLRRVSISPWCDQEKMAAELGRDYIFCRKPNPAMISTARFDEDAIREDLRTTLRLAGGCPLELVMKDVHTLNNEPLRLGRWVDLAREVCAEFGYA
ncbi:MAG TPA: hypothetical protein VLM78_05100 [Anaerolineales bacterium]|nr:hypothetical protein [Anaerolineales bacterium]